ncbi:hypothetical protein B9Z55_015858 [Caenorhabditis nigoni]|uniref:DDE-1 domain-containing protein n=1 Tax=Caenorhabditis nigoni TaxID=1611254 RepID=A0A2G5UC23_9PELO|nr:hypothetical protein B9Z55_015858 [Caenorhabditis nigoni]
MTKKHSVLFYENMLFHPSMPDDIVFVCDSWAGWIDDSARDAVMPSGYSVKKMVIPAGCTGIMPAAWCSRVTSAYSAHSKKWSICVSA